MRVVAALLVVTVGACAAPPLPPAPSQPPAPRPTTSSLPSAAPMASASAARGDPPQRAARTIAGEIGTPHPVVVEDLSRDAGWVVFCQARLDTNGDGQVAAELGPDGRWQGDSMKRLLARAAGPGEEIDELLAHDPSGRWLVVARSDSIDLVDSHTGVATSLSALGFDSRSDALALRAHRALAFDATGSRLAYLRKTGSETRIVVRELPAGTERVLEPGADEVWRIELDPTGAYVVAHVIVDDKNRDKRLSWPVPERKGPPPCRGPVPRYHAFALQGDAPSVRLVPLRGEKSEAAPGFVTTLGRGVVVREPTGKLRLRKQDQSVELSGDACGARVLLVDHEREQLLVACTKPKGRPKLELVSMAGSLALDADIAHQSRDQPDAATTRLFALYPGNDTKLLDLEARKVVALTAGDAVLAAWRARALVRRKRSLVLVDAETGVERRLEGELASSLDTLSAPPLAVAAPWVVSLESEKILGSVAGRPMGLSPDGKVLVARGRDADGAALGVGPLAWVSPSPTPAR